MNVDDWGRAIPRKGLHKCDFRCTAVGLILWNILWSEPHCIVNSAVLVRVKLSDKFEKNMTKEFHEVQDVEFLITMIASWKIE